jgi:hypothetical protein
MWSEIVEFIIAVISHWQAYVTGGAITGLVALVERLSGWTMPKRAYAVLYVGVFLLVSFFLAWRDQYHEAQKVPPLEQRTQDQEKRIADLKGAPPQLQVNVPPAIVNLPPQMAYMSLSDLGVVLPSYKIGGYLAVSGACKNLSPTAIAEEAGCVRALRLVNTHLNPLNQPVVAPAVQEKEYREFEKILPTLPIMRKSYGPGESGFDTVYSPLVDQALDTEFRNGYKTVLFLADESWRDATGRHVNETCTWLQNYPGMFSAPGAFASNVVITWNNCTKHNGLKGGS